MKWLEKLRSKSWYSSAVAFCVAILFASVLYNMNYWLNLLAGLWNVMLPVVLGIIFAYVLDPIARFFENGPFSKMKRRRVSRVISVGITIIIAVISIGLLIFALIPPLVDSVKSLINTISSSSESLQQTITANIHKITGQDISFDKINEYISSFVNKVASGEINMKGVLEVSMGVGSSIVSIVLGFVLAIYFMLYKERSQRAANYMLHRMLNKDKYVGFMDFCKKCDKIILKYIACDLLEAIFVGACNSLFMGLLGMPYISLISVIVGVTNLAPTFGPIMGAVIGSILLLLVNPWYALWFLIFTAGIQTVDGYILKPKLFGDTLGVSPLLVLITIIVGGRLFGALGILLAIPAAAIAYCFVNDYVIKKKDGEAAGDMEE